MVLKLLEFILYVVMILVEIIDEVGVLKGVFNFVNGMGSIIGDGISFYFDIDFVLFIGLGVVGEKIM